MASESQSSEEEPAKGPGDARLISKSFLGLLITQFLGATNDNILRWLVIGIGKQFVDSDQFVWILSAGSAAFVLPYVLLAAPAGYLADRFSKRNVIVICKAVEILIMIMAVISIMVGSVPLMLAIVAAMGAQSALFGPSKLGSIPEMLHESKISSANGVLELVTVVATTVGMIVGNLLATKIGTNGQEFWWLSASVLVGFSVAGLLASSLIRSLPSANPARTFPWNAASQAIADVKTLSRSRAMLRIVLGIVFFWSLAMLAQLNIDQFAFQGGATKQTQVATLLIPLIVGVGLGSVLAGLWSGGRVELGILPLGAGGLALSGLLLFTVEGELFDPSKDWTASYLAASLLLFSLGSFAGLFNVPLAAYVQRYSDPKNRGTILAACNFLTFSGMLACSGAYWLMGPALLDLSARQIFLVCGVLTIPVFIYIMVIIPQASLRFLAWLITHTLYKIRVLRRQNLPESGGALLAPNHVSWIDGLILIAVSPRPIRMIISEDLVTNRWTRRLAQVMGAIPIHRRSPRAAFSAIETARKALNNGELVCIFPEGNITGSGQLQAFRPSTLEIVRGTSADVIPVYLDELWGSIFTFRRGRFFWKWPSLWSRHVSVWFGEKVQQPKNIYEVRQAVQNLGAEAVSGRKERMIALPRLMLRKCRKSMFKMKVADSTGAQLSGAALLMRTFILRRLLRREVLAPDERYVGILIPPTAGAVVVNTAVTLAGRVSVNLNYTVTNDILNACIHKAGIKHVLTTRKVLEKFDFDMEAEVILLDDLREKLTLVDKLAAAAMTFLTPMPILERILGIEKMTGDDELTVIFTSGSTGIPKGVVLTNHNVGSNVEAIDQVIRLTPADTLIGILPFFHSFGYTVTLWTVLGLDVNCVYHTNPREARQIGKLISKWGATVMLATPTFLRLYLRRCEREEFKTLDLIVTGAEKLPTELSAAFEKKMGVRPIEGYGTTELSPLAAVNVPPSRSQADQTDSKEGTVGRPIPGVSAKTVDPDSLEDLSQGETGMLLIKGPNVMQGYLDDPEKTAEVIRDGWYVTGDMAFVDREGFIHITGRLSRFSKIGGEMVPHINVEEAIQAFVQGDEDDEVRVAISAVSDEKKGERLLVLYTQLDHTPQEISDHLSGLGMPNLWIPGRDSYVQVDSIPLLGTGKLDLKAISDLAKSHFSGN